MQTSQLYEQYKNDFIQNCQKLSIMSPKNDFNDYKKLVKDNNLILRQIAIELQSLGKKKADEQRKVLKPFNDSFMSFKKKLTQAELLHQVIGQKDLDQTRISAQNQVYEQNQKLSETKKLLYEMEQTSRNIGQNLANQSQGLIDMKSKVQGIRQVLNKANQLVDIMLKRQNRRKSVVWVVLFLVIAVILVFKFSF